MKAPSRARLMQAFPHIDSYGADLIRALAKAVAHEDLLRPLIISHCSATDAYARSCHGDPYDSRMWRTTLALHAIDQILGTYGVEALGRADRAPYAPPYEYCNTGDPYRTTLIYHRDVDALRIGAWGDIAEKMGDDDR